MSVTLHVTESNTVVSPVDSSVTLEVSSNTATLELADTLSYSSMTAGDILTSIKTVDGTGSGLDADTVDGSHASAFEPSLGNPGVDGYVLSSTAAGTRSWVSNAGGGGGASDVSELTTSTGSSTNMVRVAAGGGLEYRTTAQVLSDIGGAASSHTHTESDITDLGDYAVSGHTHDYAASSHTHVEADITDLGSYLTTVAINDVSDITITTPADNEVLAYNSGTSTWINQTAAEAGLAAASHTHTESEITDLGSYATTTALSNHEADTTSIHGIADTSALVTTSDYTAADVLTKVKTVDGTGSGLDADLLDGNEATAFAAASHTHTESDITDLGSYLTSVAINDVSDITITTPADNEVLAYNSGTSTWINQTASEAGLAAASHNHATTDITSGTMADARIAASNVTQHQAALSITESQISDLGSYLTSVALDGVSDVTITAPADNEVLAYNSGTSTWINQTAAEAGLAAASHAHATTDITSGTMADARIAQSNVTQHQAALSITESQISDLGSYLTSVAINDVSDITITTPADNEVLAYNGAGAWINQTAAEAGLAAASHTHTESDITDLGSYLTSVALADVSDVTITTPADNEVLAYNSGTSTWINQTAAEAGLAAASHSHATSDITSGTFADALVAQSNVTQHQGAIDHGSIAGLGDDDHTQYALLAGRSGGTTLYGGTAAADDFTIDSTSNATKGDLVLQPSGGNVGIGTTSPSQAFEVHNTTTIGVFNATASAGYSAFRFQESGTTKWSVQSINSTFATSSRRDDLEVYGSVGSGDITLWTNGAERMAIDSSGNVGIGTSSPGEKLEVAGYMRVGTGTAGRIYSNADTSQVGLFGGASFPTSSYIIANGTSNASQPGNINFTVNSAGGQGKFIWQSYNGASTWTDRMIIDSSGNVGIGTTLPEAMTHINADSTVALQIDISGTRRVGFFQNENSDTYNASIPLAIHPFDNGTNAGPRVQIGRNSNASTPAAGHMLLRNRSNGAYRMWIDSSGNLRVWSGGDPTYANDTEGTVVGTQTSMAAAKHIAPDLSPLDAVAERIRAGANAVRKFAYKSGAFGGQEFEGVVVDEAPEYGMDRDAEHPAGKSLNEIQIAGDLLRMVANLNERVSRLEA